MKKLINFFWILVLIFMLAVSASANTPQVVEAAAHTSWEEQSGSVNWWIAIGAGLLIAGITVAVMCWKMNTRRRQNSAGAYLQEDTFRLKGHADLFLYSTVSKTAKPKNNSASND